MSDSMRNAPPLREEDIAAACAALARGEVVCVPTETVYGLAVDATNVAAVRALYILKERPDQQPTPVQVFSIEDVAKIVPLDMPSIGSTEVASSVGVISSIERVETIGGARATIEKIGTIDTVENEGDMKGEGVTVPESLAMRVMRAGWPGALTVILRGVRASAGIVPTVLGEGGTIGLRVPAHPVMRALLRAYGRPLAVPSANHRGDSPATTVAAARAIFGDRVAYYLDGGACALGVSSTLVDFSGAVPKILRQGTLTVPELSHIDARHS